MSTPAEQPADQLAPRQGRAVVALLEAGHVKAAARKAGVGYATLRRWLKEPAFRQALAGARREALGVALAGLQGGAAAAVRALRRALKDAGARVRVRAADAYLRHLGKATELLDVEERLRALEDRLAGEGGKPA